MTITVERAVLAGGCFWGMQELLRTLPGVLDTRVGYSGGHAPHATYEMHRGHAESVEITFDKAVTDYRTVLEYFFQIHDPTTVNRQGGDVGLSYRSVIFYLNEDQRRVAKDTIAEVDNSGLWPGKVVTEVLPVGPFWEAEPEHQNYLRQNPDGYTCHFPRPNWRLAARTES
ncbi:peptide-methionine (S)-S-oxide reductase MsrA [Streptomyces sp. NPDC006173]|uniref:peptide-methionine (S)-S-oxide reductase MsrA n=1 Tax=Streptomyces sp. NPDC006173 TaxID=3155349 RepID=UPI0033F635C8